jgi:hypothetical protein
VGEVEAERDEDLVLDQERGGVELRVGKGQLNKYYLL